MRRSHRPPAGPLAILLGFLLALALALGLVHAARGADPGPPWAPHRYIATVRPEEVIDGDTFTAIVATDFGVRLEPIIRIAGFDAMAITGPNRPAGERARANLIKLLAGRPVYLDVLVTSGGRPLRSFERYVSRVYVAQDGRLVDVSDLMIQSGFGVPLGKGP